MLLHQRLTPRLRHFVLSKDRASITIIEGKIHYCDSETYASKALYRVKTRFYSSMPFSNTWRSTDGIVFSKEKRLLDQYPISGGLRKSSSQSVLQNSTLLSTLSTKPSSPLRRYPVESHEQHQDVSSISPLEGDPLAKIEHAFALDPVISVDMEPSIHYGATDGLARVEKPYSSSHVCSEYRIPESKLRESMLASRTTRAAYWQYSMYESSVGEKVKVIYCKTIEATERIAQLFLDKEVVGFDIEWKPNASFRDGIKKNVALVQLASEERIALFHIARYPGDGIDNLVSPTFRRIMESEEITKVGVSVKADCTRLLKFLGIQSRGLFELSHLYKLIKHSNGNGKMIDKRLVSLANQVEEHLQLPMWKGEVRSSDWSQDLGYQQITYAASDSYAGLQLYIIMEAKRKLLMPTPPRPAHAELNLPIELANGHTVVTHDDEVTDEVIDEGFAREQDDQQMKVEEMVRDFLDITMEDKLGNKRIPSSGIPTPRLEKPPEIVAAEEWANRWRINRLSNGESMASPAFLKAYFLWHHLGKEVPVAAAILREPPLQVSTVSNYVLAAIRLANLPYRVDRLSDVLVHLPEPIAKARAESLRKQSHSSSSMRHNATV